MPLKQQILCSILNLGTPSPYNAGLWDQFIDCSNPHEVKTEYYDDYGKFDEYMRNGIFPNRDLILICGTGKWIPTQESIMRIISSFINDAVLNAYNRKR